ncbi:hypothetical protein [Desulfobotulus alkaliphilus]|uniref:hypothetical protein n=1 Tax=Desulfobotulus alkaliphilus TaxID=622671 RepID=UPI0011A9BAF5|nr:hypothetical protein [Desulfobotulus alkaliphilus]
MEKHADSFHYMLTGPLEDGVGAACNYSLDADLDYMNPKSLVDCLVVGNNLRVNRIFVEYKTCLPSLFFMF